MEILKLFVCILIVKSVTANLTELRVERPTKTNDVLRVMRSAGRLNDFKRVFELIDEKDVYKNIGISARKYLILNLLNKTHSSLKSLSSSFMLWTAVYLMQILSGYMEIAIRLLNDKSLSVSDQKKREVLRFEDEPEYCMLTAFYDWGGIDIDLFEANLLFESSYFLQTIRADAKSSLSDLEFQLQSYIHRYDLDIKVKETKNLRDRFTTVPTTSFTNYSNLLSDMKKEFRNLSRVFCSVWTPYVRSDLLRAETQLNYVQDKSPFVRYAFHYEMCEINFQHQINVPNQISEFADHERIQEENQQNQITTWNCEKILDSPEYRYEMYNKNETSGRKPSSKPADIPFKGKQQFSLAAFRNGLKSNNHYMNAVKYYNIVADAILLVALKEGNKILRGIKLAVVKKCTVKPIILLAGEVKRLRCALDRFKSILDQLVSLILDKRHIDVGENQQNKTFDALVDLVMKLFDVKNDQMTDDHVQRICERIPIILENIKDDHVFTGFPLKFVSFYFFETILNIRELYQYVESDF